MSKPKLTYRGGDWLGFMAKACYTTPKGDRVYGSDRREAERNLRKGNVYSDRKKNR